MKKALKKILNKWVIGVIAVVIVGGGIYAATHRGNSSAQLISVTRGSVTETVSVTGNTTAVQNVSLGFESAGTVSRVNFEVGDKVAAGQVLASLNASDLAAQLKQAQANVDAENARLAGLQAGSRPEDIAASQAALSKAQQDLANIYAGIADKSADSYAKANDAVRTQLSVFFTNGESNNPQLTFQTNSSQAGSAAATARASATAALNSWQSDLSTVTSASSVSDTTTLLNQGVTALSAIRNFLTSVSTALNGATSLDATTLAQYKADVTVALNEVNTASSNLNAIVQSIPSQQATVDQAKASLALKQAGSTAQDIAAQQAQVEQAQASVESVQAKLQNSQIVAPISGVITQMDAKVGQTASPNTPLVSIISQNGYEIDANIPETDIGKVAVGNTVDMTLDAFPGETFQGSVFYIDPAETITQGVVDYKIKVSFKNPDTRIKSGLTANLNIETRVRDNVLILPQYAILQNDQGTFVEVVENGKTVNKPVTLGIQDQKGNVEITSGVTEGEQVMNIGLKSS